MNNKILFYSIFSKNDKTIKVLFYAKSIKSAKSFKTKYAKNNNLVYVQGGHAYTLNEISENINNYKLIN